MAYFPHAFRKTFVFNDNLFNSGNISILGPGLAGFYDAKTFNAVPLGEASVLQHPKVVFAMGGYRTWLGHDTFGSHGGFAESVKSPVIEPLRVHRFWKVPGAYPIAHIVRLGWDGSDAATAPKFYCGQTYHLRIDVKGSPVLRLVDHNVYHIFDVTTDCCPGDLPALVDPVAVLLAFAQQINQSPIVSKFLSASVFNSGGAAVNPLSYVPLTDATAIANATAALKLTGAYSDTVFRYFTFDPRDHFELEPVVIASAQLMDDPGDPCSLFKQLTFTEVQAPKGPQGTGELIKREFILDNEYRQDPFFRDMRMKDIFDSVFVDSVVNTTDIYDSIYILFDSPRRYNPSGTFDNDVYLLRFCASSGAGIIDDVAAWFGSYLSSAGAEVALEEMG
jgi:hypothetical protein